MFRYKNDSEANALAGKTSRTLVSLVALAMLPYLIPALSGYRLLSSSGASGLMTIPTGEAAMSDVSAGQGRAVSSESDLPGGKAEATPGEVEDPSGRALDNYFASLLKVEREGGHSRVCHYGDSPITNDGITSTVRRRLQLRFGDAGHGFILTARPWGWYAHTGVSHDESRGWSDDPMAISRGDHIYGLGCVSFTNSAAGEWASFSTTEEGEVGHSVSAFDIYYLAQPGGGDFDVEVDGATEGRVATASDEVKSGFYRVEVKEGGHSLVLRVVGNGEVRVFGVVLESGARGVEYDSLGVNGAYIGLLANYLDVNHWAEQLRHRKPDLVIIGYGTNESQFERLPMDQYERDTREAIRRIRAALPGVSIMLVGPMDRAMRGAGGTLVTRPMIPKLISYQRRIASDTGCAFFDTYTAMGGEGTAARWCLARPRLMGGDYTHPTAQGAEIVGTLIYDAMMRAYEKYKDRETETALNLSRAGQ